jgi:hypothetical protein
LPALTINLIGGSMATNSHTHTHAPESNELERLAEADGASLRRSAAGVWYAKDKDGAVVVRGALSRVEAALLYCEDRDLVASTPEAILARIRHEYRPYDSMPEFEEGFRAYQLDGATRRDPYEGVKAQAWDRGANAAMLYKRALAHLDVHPPGAEPAAPGWLAQLLRTGRC